MTRRTRRDSVQQLTLSGVLLSVMLVLGFIEHSLPALGVPGIKLGLSNSVLIFAVYMLDLPAAWALMAMKVTLSGFLFSGPSAMMYAFAGGALSMTAMSLLSRIPRFPAVAVSVAGGVAHNAGQVVLAILIAHLPTQMLWYLALLAGVGAACGALTGVAAELTMSHLRGRLRIRPRRDRDRAAVVVLVILLVAAAGVIAWLSLPKPDVSGLTVEVT